MSILGLILRPIARAFQPVVNQINEIVQQTSTNQAVAQRLQEFTNNFNTFASSSGGGNDGGGDISWTNTHKQQSTGADSKKTDDPSPAKERLSDIEAIRNDVPGAQPANLNGDASENEPVLVAVRDPDTLIEFEDYQQRFYDNYVRSLVERDGSPEQANVLLDMQIGALRSVAENIFGIDFNLLNAGGNEGEPGTVAKLVTIDANRNGVLEQVRALQDFLAEGDPDDNDFSDRNVPLFIPAQTDIGSIFIPLPFNYGDEKEPTKHEVEFYGAIFPPVGAVLALRDALKDVQEGNQERAAIGLALAFGPEILEQAWNFIKWGAGRIAARLGSTRTFPSFLPDASRLPTGTPETVEANWSQIRIEDHELEIESLDVLSRAGYKVEHVPDNARLRQLNYQYPIRKGPDAVVEERIMDVGALRPGSSINTAWDVLERKSNVQASRVILNISRTPDLDLDALRREIIRTHESNLRNLEEVIVVRGEEVIHLWSGRQIRDVI